MKNKKLLCILAICIAILTATSIHKTLENDTFFTIPTGNYILQHGVDETEPFTWHNNLKFIKLRWGFDVTVSLIYKMAGFTGLYIFIIIISILIGESLFFTLVKRKNNPIVSFLVSLFIIICIKGCLKCRGQIMSYLFFVWQIFSIQMLLETGKKRYSVYLVIISFLLLTFHSSVWLAHFIFYAPYVVEWILNKLKIHKVLEKTEKIELNSYDSKTMKLFFITIGIVLITGFLTPLKLSPFTYMFKVMGGYSSKIILELQKQKIANTKELLTIIIGILGILSITKTKIKFTDVCLVVGLMIMSTLAVRNMFIALVVLASPITSLITSYINTYNKQEIFDKIDEKLNRSYFMLIIILLFCIIISIDNYRKVYKEPYVNGDSYPVAACDFIINNLDMGNMRLYNHFNFGSYLEYRGIPAFMDSRSEVYCEEFSNVTILKDFGAFDLDLQVSPEYMVEKYGITHFMFMSNNSNAANMKYNDRYKLIYDDGSFVIYEVNQDKDSSNKGLKTFNVEKTVLQYSF